MAEQLHAHNSPPVESGSRPSAGGWRLVVGLTALAIWVMALGFYSLDRVLGLGFFPTRLERLLTRDVEKLGDPDPEVRKQAEGELFSYHGFAVPALILGMKSQDEQRKEGCAECLQRIASYYYNAKPNYGADAEKWSKWWEKMDRSMTELLDRKAAEQQRARQEGITR